jgi:16S rRNA (cytidine1402-2'-O)-methyltransferase
VIACEDTRVARKLLTRVPGARARLTAYHARNERARAPELVRAIASGARVALTTDAGMPGLSDPGHHLIAAAIDAGLRVEVIPGPSAVLGALVVSGLPTARFVFEGFLPRTAGARRRRLEELRSEERTIVVFESPHRLAETVRAMAEVLGARRAAVVRELTKMHEESWRATLPELAARAEDEGARGEITIVIEGAARIESKPDAGDLAAEVNTRVAAGSSRRDAIAGVAAERGVPKNVVYRAVTG